MKHARHGVESKVITAGVLMVVLSAPFFCAPAHAGMLNRIRNSLQNLWGQSASQRHEARAARSRASQLNSRSESLHEKLEKQQQLLIRANAVFHNYRYQVKETEARIVRARHRVQIVQSRYERHKALFGARLASMQQHGQLGYLNMLLGSRTLSDLSRRAYMYQAIAERDCDLQQTLKDDRAELEEAQNELMSQWHQRNRIQQAANRERSRIVRAQKAQLAYWKELRSSMYAQLVYAAAKEETAQSLETEIQQLLSQRAAIIAAYEAQQARERQQQYSYAPRRRYSSYRRYRRQRVARRVTRTRYVREGGVLKPMAIRDIVYEDVMVPIEEQSDVLSEDYQVNHSSHSHDENGWCAPTRGRLSSRYGMRFHPILRRRKLHTGDDIAARSGAPIRAAKSGRVLYSGWKKGYGNTVIIDHGDGVTTLYGHASKLGVKPGQPIKSGEYIANVGSTGYSTGPHLHFEVRKNGKPINPRPYLKKAR